MVAFALLGLTACGQLDTSAVEQQRVQLKSTVAEASFLADSTAHSEFTAPFVKARAEELGEDATKVQSDLADSQVAAPAKAKAARLREAARLLAAAMDRLSASPGDPHLAAGLSAQLRQAQAALDAT